MMGWQWHQLDHMQIICTLLQTDNHASTSSLNFYRSEALPNTEPTMSNTEGKEQKNKNIAIYKVGQKAHFQYTTSMQAFKTK